MGERFRVGADLGSGRDFERVVIIERPGRVAIVCDRDEARHLATALYGVTGGPPPCEGCAMACVTPADDCDCAGCLYAAEARARREAGLILDSIEAP